MVLTDKICIHLSANKDMTDVYNIKRKAGDNWLIGIKQAETHIIDVNEQFEKTVQITSLSSRQYCYLKNPIIDGKRQWGQKILKKGEDKFFLNPGETLEGKKVFDITILAEDEALLLKAKDSFKEDGKKIKAGSIQLKRGPCEYIPPIEVEIMQTRKAFPLDKNEGIYVRDKRNGEVKLIRG